MSSYNRNTTTATTTMTNNTTTTNNNNNNFPTIMKHGDLMRYICSNPDVLELNSIVQFPRYTTKENDYTFTDLIKALRYKHCQIRIIQMNRHFTTGFTEYEFNEIITSFGCMKQLEELIFVDTGDSRLRRIRIDIITNRILKQSKSLKKLLFGKFWLLIGNDTDRIYFAQTIASVIKNQQFIEFQYEGCGTTNVFQSIASRIRTDSLLLSFASSSSSSSLSAANATTYLTSLCITNFPYHASDYSYKAVYTLIRETRHTLQHLQLVTSQWIAVADALTGYSYNNSKKNTSIVSSSSEEEDDHDDNNTTNKREDNNTNNNNNDWNQPTEAKASTAAISSSNDISSSLFQFALKSLTLIDYGSLIPTATIEAMVSSCALTETVPHLRHITLCGWRGGFHEPTICTETIHTILTTKQRRQQQQQQQHLPSSSSNNNNNNLQSITLSDGCCGESNNDQRNVNNRQSCTSRPLTYFTTHDILTLAQTVRQCNTIRIVLDCTCIDIDDNNNDLIISTSSANRIQQDDEHEANSITTTTTSTIPTDTPDNNNNNNNIILRESNHDVDSSTIIRSNSYHHLHQMNYKTPSTCTTSIDLARDILLMENILSTVGRYYCYDRDTKTTITNNNDNNTGNHDQEDTDNDQEDTDNDSTTNNDSNHQQPTEIDSWYTATAKLNWQLVLHTKKQVHGATTITTNNNNNIYQNSKTNTNKIYTTRYHDFINPVDFDSNTIDEYAYGDNYNYSDDDDDDSWNHFDSLSLYYQKNNENEGNNKNKNLKKSHRSKNNSNDNNNNCTRAKIMNKKENTDAHRTIDDDDDEDNKDADYLSSLVLSVSSCSIELLLQSCLYQLVRTNPSLVVVSSLHST